MKRILAVLFITAFALTLPTVLYAQDVKQECRLRSAAGKISAVDWVGSLIVVRGVGENGYDEITIYVPDNTPITKGIEKITLADVELSDAVYVEYRDCGLAGLKAEMITVNANG